MGLKFKKNKNHLKSQKRKQSKTLITDLMMKATSQTMKSTDYFKRIGFMMILITSRQVLNNKRPNT